ncbi:MAG: IgGFc-binding protein [Chitinophagaceae bacterium]|nr:IgGFc-binding protein [Chitinophagaceae bacterium]
MDSRHWLYSELFCGSKHCINYSSPIPKAGLQDARLITESTIPEKKGIHITSDKPIVAYAHTGVDLTGSKIQSINTGAGCKRIGVFSGSGRISITCNGISSSSDSYMVQAFPKSAWGKKYLTASASGGMDNNIYRVCVADPSTIVTVNGAPIAVPLQNGFYYELPITISPMKIEAD